VIDSEVQKILDKQHKLRELRRARERLRQLERELNGAPDSTEELPQVPEFLRLRLPQRVV
jgi:hypothetical protein